VAEDEVGSVVVNPDAELAFGVGDDAMMTVPYRDADVCQGGVRSRVQNGSSDRSGLSNTGFG
jgi:hypothetical protein